MFATSRVISLFDRAPAAKSPTRRLRCRWHYSTAEHRLVQTWEVCADEVS